MSVCSQTIRLLDPQTAFSSAPFCVRTVSVSAETFVASIELGQSATRSVINPSRTVIGFDRIVCEDESSFTTDDPELLRRLRIINSIKN